jgi:hypothetical protein
MNSNPGRLSIKMMLLIAATSFALGALIGYFAVPLKQDFESCVIKNLEKANSESAARLLASTCRSMHPRYRFVD